MLIKPNKNNVSEITNNTKAIIIATPLYIFFSLLFRSLLSVSKGAITQIINTHIKHIKIIICLIIPQ